MHHQPFRGPLLQRGGRTCRCRSTRKRIGQTRNTTLNLYGFNVGGMADDAGPSPSRRRLPVLVIIEICVAALIFVAIVGYVAFRVRQHQEGLLIRPTGIPASVSTRVADLMQLSPVPVTGAPGFTLTDQAGHTVSLAGFRGRVVVLEFMDPHCTDICPIVSQEYVDAYHDLGPLAGHVVFAAVNVNQYHTAVSDMMAYSREQRLITIPDWHFFTGPVPDLREVWNGYEITVQAPSPDADIVHTSAVYFIDPAGRERFVAAPMADHTSSGASYLPAGQITAWGQGIAQVARALAR